MFTLLADAMYTATLAKRGSKIPERLKTNADRYVPSVVVYRGAAVPCRLPQFTARTAL